MYEQALYELKKKRKKRKKKKTFFFPKSITTFVSSLFHIGLKFDEKK